MRAIVFVFGLALLACEPRQIDLRTEDTDAPDDTGSEEAGADDEQTEG